ncbi:unnamed protein product [Brugia timori]|uniref:Uncharacterized protein n=1 Tax=Brugia timori TaxID=42155 RepID=A0A0R3RB66_9BILA|nr:unnamed protein product [Brugia timori]
MSTITSETRSGLSSNGQRPGPGRSSYELFNRSNDDIHFTIVIIIGVIGESISTYYYR